jgi:hypothetical protein
MRGVQNIKTMAGLVDGRRTRSSSGALLELSMLEMERQRLKKEMLRIERRWIEIDGRINDIERKQLRLQRFVEKPEGEKGAGKVLPIAQPLPIHTAPTERLKRRQLSY